MILRSSCGAVNRQHQRLFQERILDVIDLRVQRDNAIFAGLGCISNQSVDQLAWIIGRLKKNLRE